MEKITLLLDGDVFAYQAAVAAECAIVWDDDVTTLDANLPEATAFLDDKIAEIKKELKAHFVVVALSDVGSNGYWRRQVLPSYKMNRKGGRKPLLLAPLRAYLIDKYYAKLKPMLEGDDVLGIFATHPTLIPGKKIIVSIDKDMKTIPGFFYRNITGKCELLEISEEEANYWHMYQTLCGDSTDGYKGCPGIGPVAAHRLLDGKVPDDMWVSVVLAFHKAGLTRDDALVQARVARILRSSDYDFELKQPILWNPPPGVKGQDDIPADPVV